MQTVLDCIKFEIGGQKVVLSEIPAQFYGLYVAVFQTGGRGTPGKAFFSPLETDCTWPFAIALPVRSRNGHFSPALYQWKRPRR